MKEGLQISFDDFLNTVLEISEEDYIKSIRASLQSSRVFLKREPSEIRVNPYMKQLLAAWKANHDIQFVLDPYACAVYIVSYVSKSQRGMSSLLHRACKEAKEGNKDLKQRVRHIGNQFLNAVEICAQEAAYLALQLPLTHATRQVVFINTSPPEERVFLLKSKEALESLPANSTDIECNSVISWYSKRPRSLEHWCLADYVSKLIVHFPDEKPVDPFADNLDDDEVDANEIDVDIENNHPLKVNLELKSGMTIKERKNPRIIRYVRYSEKMDKENHCREKLLLFFPWRNEERICWQIMDHFQLIWTKSNTL